MSTENVSNYYMGSFIVSLIGGIMVLVGEFAGWYNYGYYVEEWGSVSTFTGSAFLILGPVAAGMLYVAYLSYNGTKEEPTIDQLELMLKISKFALIAILAGGLLFIALASENTDWWFGEGFYGGAIGSLISTLLLRNAKNAQV
ncbi:MAG: hypothetical protein GPJ54_03715 [Candidatus Heimdallarchaeota archaeon]|nr:hypothetical protein [Candidatus Heimdallarchaeota archaeon]